MSIAPEAVTVLVAAVSAFVGALAGIIKVSGNIKARAAEEAHRRDEWERDLIDRQRQDLAVALAASDQVRERELLLLKQRITDLEGEVKRLKAALQDRDDELVKVRNELDEAKRKIQKLEIVNAGLEAQRSAQDEQTQLLREQNAELYKMAEGWNTFARQYMAKPADRQEAKAA